jgi:phage tail-like protein
MSCAPGPPTFRLLDHLVGWDPLNVYQLTDPDDPNGIQLARAGPDSPERGDFLPWLPDTRLAPGCGRCAWYLAVPQRGLLRRTCCGGGWQPAWLPDCDPALAACPHAITARGHLLAAATPEAVYVWRRDGDQLVAVIPGHAAAVALAPWGEILLARDGSADLSRFDLAGVPRGRIVTKMTGRIGAITTGRPLMDGECTIWALTDTGGMWQLWRGDRSSPDAYQQATLNDLKAAVDRTSLSVATGQGFCLTEAGPDGDLVTACFDWDGQPVGRISPSTDTRQKAGQLLTTAIDSGQPRCRWHRVRVDADVPAGTSVTVAVATSDEPTPAGATAGPAGADGYPTGLPNPGDWQDAGAASADFLIKQAPGRYLSLRLRLTGNGTSTPVVHRIQLDFPRVTSADQLPAVYTQDPAAADFTERFLSLFDAAFEDADRAVERYPALLDPSGVPDAVLPWLGGLLGLVFDPGWDATIRRNLIEAAPRLYRGRGTQEALRDVIKIVFGVDAAISELATDRDWAVLKPQASPLGSTRLFSRSRSRFRVGGSALSSAPIRSFGNPDDDPLTAQANRIRVQVLPAPGRSGPDLAAVRQLVVSQAPAHTVAEVRPGGLGLVVGVWSSVGVDTALVPLPAPVLGAGTQPGAAQPVTLRHGSVLWPTVHGSWAGIRLGAGPAVGIHTVAQ